MSKYTIELTPEINTSVQAAVKNVEGRIASGELPEYAIFVNNLFKEMESAHEELHHVGTGISTEAGEILDITKKVWVYRKPLDVHHLLEELGDLRYYYQAALNMLGVTDSDIIANNMQKLAKRYASGKYSDAQAIARADKPIERKFMAGPPVVDSDHPGSAG